MDQELSVLDFGCGPGYIWDHLQSLGARWKYTGIDFSADAVSQLERKAITSARFVGAHHITRLPTFLPPGSFDAILLFEVLEHLSDTYLEETVEEVGRLLKDGGVLVVSTPNEERLSDAEKYCPECGAIFHEWQHVRSWSLSMLSKYIEEFGFRIVTHEELDFSATGLLHKIIRGIKIILNKEVKRPHLIAVFRKIPAR
jgi:2-polyprenyl-3-methyl-5-hydroxy-6-metoxy-1,4-benzoquinol methylase